MMRVRIGPATANGGLRAEDVATGAVGHLDRRTLYL
jgi:hypothetical protein